ncbi:hypothetical protein IA57_11500 [Mangrovimonas yunxiaonensis]|uniref:Import component protein n=1 Tax=Mangrovimonas yunxiaonensis TaxID=1197477 RepID=A0A084THX1_9FLAO|nr:hypothetical protein [Mangrovimonas yunxiaonensis]KFB00307.1 hypothetical protein IA57_11500 [Mangrovimonas yunxiaonensis]MBR9757670.1 hypothetical protein [Algicola sp.]GGH41618.1 membrane protein [Mangrovimonas yunxiaonensis]
MNNATINEGKSLAIVSYLTFIGLIIAVLMNMERKNPFTFFHIRQMLGLILMLIVSNVTEAYINSLAGTILWTITFVCWLFGLFYAIKGEARPIPLLGEKFQEWFKNIQ